MTSHDTRRIYNLYITAKVLKLFGQYDKSLNKYKQLLQFSFGSDSNEIDLLINIIDNSFFPEYYNIDLERMTLFILLDMLLLYAKVNNSKSINSVGKLLFSKLSSLEYNCLPKHFRRKIMRLMSHCVDQELLNKYKALTT